MQWHLAFASFVKNPYSGGLTCRGGLIKFYPMFYSSHEIWIQYGSKNMYINLLSKPEFRENLRGDSCTLLKALNEFLSYFSPFLPDFSETGGEHMLGRIFSSYLNFS